MKSLLNLRNAFIILPISLLGLSLVNKSDIEDPRVAKIVQKNELFRNLFEQQKIYIQTDKSLYITGETIWIKAYLMDALSFTSDTLSKEIFVELFDQNQGKAGNIILRNNKGISEGYILLSDTLIEGNYQLRAYTNWMRNFDQDYFFHKTISIKNPGYGENVTRRRLKRITDFNKDLKKKEKDFKITFFPEGGDLVAGLPCRVAFKVENGSGIPQEGKGALLDNIGNEVVKFETVHDGMGSFIFVPRADNRYKAIMTFSNGNDGKFDFPEVLSTGVTMSVEHTEKGDIKVIIRPGENFPEGTIIVIAQSRSQIAFISAGEIRNKQIVSVIPVTKLPAGITQITLFNNEGEPVCERLVFIKPLSGKDINSVDLSTTVINDSVFCRIKVMPGNSEHLSGNFSFSVVENLSDRESRGNENILTNLLLTSDIKGRINNPAYYFNTNNPDASGYLDLIMLTNGWRRFVWKDLLEDNFPVINYSREGGISFTGTVYADNISEIIPDCQVVMSFLNKLNYKLKTTTDIKGKFDFPVVEYDDSDYVKIETIQTSKGKQGHIAIDEVPAPGENVRPYPSYFNEEYNSAKLKDNTKRENAELKKKPQGNQSNKSDPSSIKYYNPSFVLKIGEDARGYRNVFEFIKGKIPGLSIYNDQVTIRGVRSFNATNEALFIFDGVQVDYTTINNLQPIDIDRVEVVKGDEAAVFGSRGSNGVLLFYSKRANNIKMSSIELKMNGYQKTREFYIPPEESWKFKPENSDVARTIFWKPSVFLDSDGEAVIGFKQRSASDKYNITIEGLTDSGEIIYKEN
jgi:hypothetical protein